MSTSDISIEFLKSALSPDSEVLPLSDFHSWMYDIREKVEFSIKPIPFRDLEGWYIDKSTGNIHHDSGKFFSIEGIHITTNWGIIPEWEQPIINQPEIGFLGIIVKKFNKVLHFLMQAKIEPGNINVVQLSPTLQATKSNYTRVHRGHAPDYLGYFTGKINRGKVLLDQLQSEQGARFLKKRNRNIIIEVFDEIEVKENFCWLTLGQIKQLLGEDNVINMDTRTVISGIPYGNFRTTDKSLLPSGNHRSIESDMLSSELEDNISLNSSIDLISWITRLKFSAELEVERIALNKIGNWLMDDNSFYHYDRKYFSVIAVRAAIGSREVREWTQPMIKSAQDGIIAFIIRKINGVYHFLVQAKMEAGNFDIIELAPTVQCLTGNYRKGKSEYDPHFLDYVLEAESGNKNILHSSYQSEEGGRFYYEQNKNLIIEAEEDFPVDVPERFIWMTLNQLKTFIRFNNYINIQARSLLSTIRFI